MISSLCEQGYDDVYVNGTCHELLKWKFAHMNSVDFLLLIESGRLIGLQRSSQQSTHITSSDLISLLRSRVP